MRPYARDLHLRVVHAYAHHYLSSYIAPGSQCDIQHGSSPVVHSTRCLMTGASDGSQRALYLVGRSVWSERWPAA